MNEYVLQFENQTYGTLRLLDYIAQKGAHVRAELYYPIYELMLSDTRIPGHYSNSFLMTAQTLFLTEMFLDIDKAGYGSFIKTTLVSIDLQSLQKKTISQMRTGYVRPLRCESNQLIYTKTDHSGSIVSEFEQSL